MKDFTIGVLGGMGTYATIHLFQQYAELFPAEKEWDRPRIIIDNNCVMPSRVRAILYHENVDLLVQKMASSLSLLLQGGADRIVLGCNTSHLFLDDVYQIVPEAKEKVVNIIDACVEELQRRGISDVYLLATEGTIVSGVYNKKLEKAGIRCASPDESDFASLRQCIEAVKQNKYDEETRQIFAEFCSRGSACILGCTELPILYDRCRDLVSANQIFDPLYIALQKIHQEYEVSLSVQSVNELAESH